jgi:hypothetical protein
MPTTYLTGWISDVRKRVPFIATTATLIPCSHPEVSVINQQGQFFVPHLEPRKVYEFIARNGSVSKRVRVVIKPGHNELGIELRTKDVRIPRTGKTPPLKQQQAGR